MNILSQDTDDISNISIQHPEYIESRHQLKTPISKRKSVKALQKSEPNTAKADTANLENLIDSIDPINFSKNFHRIDNEIIKLKHKNTLTSQPFSMLSTLTQKIQKIIVASIASEISSSYLKESKILTKLFEPAKIYLNLVGTPNIDQRLLIDEILDGILRLIQISLEKLIIPLSTHPNKEQLKILESKNLQKFMSGLCGVFDSLPSLISKKCFQEHRMLPICDLLIRTLFSEGAEMLHISCCFTLGSIVNEYNRATKQVIEEVINNLLIMTSNPNQAIGSKNKKLNCKEYQVAEGTEIKFSTFLIVYVIQNYSSLKNPIRIDGELEISKVQGQYQEVLGIAQHFVNIISDRCFKNRAESQEYRLFFEIFIQDLLKLIYRPEFPIAYHLLNSIAIKLFNHLKSLSATIRHFSIDMLSLIAFNLKSAIHEIKKVPIVPQSLVKVPATKHPSLVAMASICICKEGWSEERPEMVQCEECFKWFHLDCMGLDLDKYEDSSWYCDDCQLFECLNHIEILNPHIKEEELLALPKEIIEVNQQYQRVYQELIVNFLISTSGKTQECARSLFLSAWIHEKEAERLKNLWQTPSKTLNLPRLSEQGTLKLLRQYLLSFDLGLIYLHIQHRMINLLTASQPLTRTRAVKAICGIVEADPDCLSEDLIENAVTERLLDSSIAVREATVELIGKFITYKSEFSENYYTALLERLKDKGPSVRKKVIKILKDIINVDPDNERIIEIYCEVIKRIGDNSEGIRDAVISMFEEVWFRVKSQKFFMSLVKVIKILRTKDPVILLFKAIIEKNPKESKKCLDDLGQIATEQLIASNVLASSILYAKILEIISMSSADLLLDQISTLHQFLTPSQNTSEEAELLTSICIVIGRASENLSSLNIMRIKRIESQLLNLVYTQGSNVFTQALSALCKIVRLCSRNHAIITQLMERCFTLLVIFLKNKQMETKSLSSVYRGLLALGLCVKFYDSDIYESFQLEEGVSFKDSIFNVFQKLAVHENDELKERALDALSLTWVRFPDLLAKSDELILAAWKNVKENRGIIKLLSMFFEFLTHCDKILLQGEDEDKGNVVSKIQGYLEQILKCAWSDCTEVRESAAEVLKLIFLQGQINISRLITIFFCMLGDESPLIKECSFFCIEKSFMKNSDVLVINLQNSVKEAARYQFQLFRQRLLGESFYPKFYQLIQGKKLLRNKFLQQIVNLLQPNEPNFTEFVCELISILPYNSYEETSLILNAINNQVQTSGFRLLRIVKIKIQKELNLPNENVIECLLQVQIILLKNYLVSAYQLKNLEENSEKTLQKCENVSGFIEEYEEFKEYHLDLDIKKEELKKFKKKVKNI